MHACKGGLAGQAFAVATNNDSGGKKSRIRRSKEERKAMVETFIQKYQKSNYGNFPSLNLTHKEVGGSFYKVREIVRDIIQENRVLAPPKFILEEHGHSDYLEEHPLGSISMEPQIDLSAIDSTVHIVTQIEPNNYQISSEQNISSSCGSYPLELDNEQIISGVSKVVDKDEVSDGTIGSHHEPDRDQDRSMGEVLNSKLQSPQTKSQTEDEKIVNGFDVLDGSPRSDKPLVVNVDYQHNIDSAILSSEKIHGPVIQSLSNEQYHDKNDQMVDETKAVTETLTGEKFVAQNVEISQAINSNMNSGVVVETFPLRPLPKTINTVDEESCNLQEAAGTLEDNTIQHDKKTFIRNSSVFGNEKGVEKHPISTEKLKSGHKEEKVVLDLQGPDLEIAKGPSASKSSVLDRGDIPDPESKDSLPHGAKVYSYTERLISEDSTVVEGKSSDQDNSRLLKGNNPTLDRINLETWEVASKKSIQRESNPLMAFVKSFISSFVKFWTE